jgi:colicin import membrane protein
MTAAVFQSRDEALAGGLAFAMHVLFLMLLVFGVSWQHKPVETAAVVDLWRDLPSAAAPTVEEAPPAPIKPEPPPPQPKVEAKPPPKPEPAPVAKPDIALKDKREKELKLKAQLEEKKRAEEKVREAAREAEADKKKRAEADALKKKQAAEAEAKRLAGEQAKAEQALAAQQAAASAKVVDEYKRRIIEKVKRFIVLPPNVSDNAQVEFEVVVLPGGEVLGAKLKKSSNSIPAYDSAIERAILKAQPLPLPQDPALMRQFRELNLVFRPKE